MADRAKQAELLPRIGQISGGALAIEQGALYPALYRLEGQGLLDSEWGNSENNRRAKFYRLTLAGRKRLRAETESWNRLVTAITTALGALYPALYRLEGHSLFAPDWGNSE